MSDKEPVSRSASRRERKILEEIERHRKEVAARREAEQEREQTKDTLANDPINW